MTPKIYLVVGTLVALVCFPLVQRSARWTVEEWRYRRWLRRGPTDPDEPAPVPDAAFYAIGFGGAAVLVVCFAVLFCDFLAGLLR